MIIVTVAVGSGRSRHVAPKKLHQGGLLEHFLEAVINSIINSVSQLVVTHNYTFLFDLDYMYPKFCIGFKIRKSRCKQLLLSGSGHSK